MHIQRKCVKSGREGACALRTHPTRRRGGEGLPRPWMDSRGGLVLLLAPVTACLFRVEWGERQSSSGFKANVAVGMYVHVFM